jgi:acid stress-induced BolA-like protein IbaG/YrbA
MLYCNYQETRMSKTTHNSITTIEQAIQILAYNEHFWEDFKVHPMDHKTVNSLADAPYAWTEKQGRLALALLKRYHTLFKKFNIDLSELLQNPVYKDPFRVIDHIKSVEQYQHEDGRELIEIKFPYNEKLISLLRTLKNKKADGLVPMIYDGESKKWTIQYTELTCYYVTLIAVRYDFNIITPNILEDFEEIKREKLVYRPAVIQLKDNEIHIENANENLTEWWNKNYKNKKILHQFDVLKNLSITSLIPAPVAEQSTLVEKIATSMHTTLWIDRKQYSRADFLRSLEELDLFPAMVPMSGMLEQFKEVEDFEEWYRAFEELGYSHSQIAWGLTLEKAPGINTDDRKDDDMLYSGNADYVYGKDTPVAEREQMRTRWDELALESKVSKHIDQNTKLVILRNRIPRTLMKSGIRLRCGFAMQDTQYWPTNTETLARVVDNLPKRLYYVSRKPGFLETNIVQI